ncbi:MAG TPA: ABC transporter permease [Thermoflexales bacterium]|nr:ABC transporter permease [Anaerolineae bacterium]HQV28417.1 ABC transporter permease [Thermoflexales bacterium]HQX10961.1 ABC transporter permease [Thermoflexales bacterium]
MGTYILKRLLAAIPILIGISALVFFSLKLVPGDPLSAITGDAVIGKEEADRLREQYGLNDPLHIQYLNFVGRAIQGDLGRSLQFKRPVIDEIRAQLPATLQLTAAAMVIALTVGLGLGILAAIRPHSLLDGLTMSIAMAGVSFPSFWVGLMLLLIFSLALGWLPATGTEGFERLIMPAATLGFGAAAIIARLTRSSLLEVLQQQYIVTARAKGLSFVKVVFRHALRNALIPVVTIVGLQFGNLLAGAVVIETVFSRQGIGRLLVTAILGRDFPLVQGVILFVASVYVIVNLLVDLSYALIDPRIRYA